MAWQNHSFRALFLGFSCYGISISIGTTLGTHVYVFFWGFSVAQLSSLLAATAAGFVVGVVISRRLHERFEKKPALITAAVVSGTFGVVAVIGRLAGVIPEVLDWAGPFLLAGRGCSARPWQDNAQVPSRVRGYSTEPGLATKNRRFHYRICEFA